MKSRFTGILTLFLAFMIQFSFAQEKTITGVVTSSEDGLPLPGATVLVDGTTRGTNTDLDGNYSISAAAGEKLVFSSIGMANQTVTVGVSNVINVNLAPDNTILPEVLVVGYGSATKEGFVGTATKIKSENIEAKTTSNISQALRGEVAGVNVVSGSGQPGSDAIVRIRGFGSVSTIGNRAPLYVVDGIPFSDGIYGSDISSINPSDIEDMVVLKDAAATSIYGSRGANGVILITTKKGKAGTSKISVDFKTSINTMFLPQYDVITSPEEYMEISWNAVYNKGVLLGESNPTNYANNNLFGGTGINEYYNMWNAPGSQLINPQTGKFNPGVTRKYTPENWADHAFRTGYRQEANVQFSGGTEKTRFASSFGYVDDQGYGINSEFKRFSTRLNVEHQVNDWLKAGANMSYSGSRYTQNGQTADTGSIFLLANNAPPIYSIYQRDANGDKIINPNTGDFLMDFGNNGRRFSPLTNGIADAMYGLDRDYANTATGKFFFNVNLAKGLTLETQYGAQIEHWDRISMDNVEEITGNPERRGYLSRQNISSFNQNFLQLLRYGKQFGNHSVDAFVAHETTQLQEKYIGGAKQNAIIFGATDLDLYTQVVRRPFSFQRGWTLESYFAQLNYNFDQKYYLSGSVRTDGSSRFIQDKWGTFWSVGAGWVISRESFMDNVDFIDFFKIKGSYGVIGDQGRRTQYGWQRSTIGNTDDYSFIQEGELANPNLTWETSKISQVGFESSWFNNRLDIDVDYYIKNTENLFFNMTLPPSNGFTNTYVNDGQLRNSGLEFDITGHIFKAKSPEDFALSIGVNGEFLTNKITRMPIDIRDGKKKVIDGNLSEGRSVYDHFMSEWAGVDPSNGSAMWYMYFNDINGDGIFDAGDERILNMVLYMDQNPDANVQRTTTYDESNATQKYIGKSSIPKVRGAFRLNASYKNFDFTAQVGYSIGGYAYDGNYAWIMGNGLVGSDNWHVDMRNRWQKPGDQTNVPRLSDDFTSDTRFAAQSSRFLTKADYLSLNNARIGYSFPKRFIERSGLSNLNLYVSGDNLMFLSARNGFNPSTSEGGGSNIYRYMPLSTFSLGAKVEF